MSVKAIRSVQKSLFSGVTVLALAACNMTGPMNVPLATTADPVFIEKPTEEQASFAMSKVVANIRRGTVIGHYPAGGISGVDGTLCNYRHRGESLLEWGTGTSVLGNWSTELGEIFYEALSQSGLNVAGDPRDLFGQARKAQSAEYMIGGRITKIASNICQEHDAWNGFPRNSFSGEMFIDVEWTVFSTISREEVLRYQTQGYHKQKEPKSDGVILMFHNAFAHATEGLLANAAFVQIAERDLKSNDKANEESYTTLTLDTGTLSAKSIEDDVASVVNAVATIRIGAGHGSGFFVTQDGYLLTNAHVVGDAKRVAVILNNGLELQGDVIRKSKIRDIALVKVGIRVPNPLPIRSKPLESLDRVFAIGSPVDEGFKSSVTAGVVSGFRNFRGQRHIQADAAISGGNSGGPLVDENGNVVGISVSKIADVGVEGLNFFIPIMSGLEGINLAPSSTGS